MASDPLLQPLVLKNLTLRNRVMVTAHEPAYTEAGIPGARYLAYHLARARGGVALTMTAGSAVVSRDSPPAFGNVLAWNDAVVAPLRDLARALHGEGAAVMIQLTHLGRRSHWGRGDWLPLISASSRREPAHRATPKVAEDWDLDRIAADYADAAERMKAAGLDGLELETYGHLLDSFWGPLTNPGAESLQAGMAFPLRVIRAIRDRVGPDFILGVRYSAEDAALGVDAARGLKIGQAFAASGLVDFLNVIRGSIATDAGLADVIPVTGMALAPHLDFAGAVRRATGLPVFHAARIADLATARHAVASGLIDMAGMTRAHLADPAILRKLIEGREAEIRPCVGAAYCIDRIYQGAEALCLHNAATGRELALPHVLPPAPVRQRVLVVGAGPGGLEAARAAAERGHQVTVLEAADAPGGQLLLATRTPARRDLGGIIDWRMAECERLGVTFRFNTYAEAADIMADPPDVVFVATGGLPAEPELGEGAALATSAWEIIAGSVAPASSALIWDEAGDHPALQAALHVSAAGGAVEIVTRDRNFAPEVMGLSLVPYIRALQPKGAVFTVAARVDAIRREGNRLRVTLGSDYGDFPATRLVDQVIVSPGTVPNDELYFALKPFSRNLGQVDHAALADGKPQALAPNPEGRFTLWRIGDAVAGRNVHAAIYDALRLAAQI